MKKRHKIEILIMAFMLLCSVLLVSLLSTHQFSSHEVRVKNFFAEEKDTIDVVHVGASEMYAGFSPEYIWKNYGITSYNLATAGAPMGLAKSEVEAAIENQHPKLIVISLNGAVYGNKRAIHEGYTRMWLDNMPSSKIHDGAIDDLIKDHKLTYKFKMLKYHDNIARLPECISLTNRELKAKKDKELLTISGIQGQACTDDRDLSKIVDGKNYTQEEKLGKITNMQLYDLLVYLKENKVDNVIFVNMPRFYEERMFESKRRINTAAKIVKAYGYPVYDFDNDVDKIGLDPKNDFYNFSHLNAYGQQKMSKYFYEQVVPKYVTGVNRNSYSEDVQKRWDENYDAYTKVYQWISKTIDEKSQYKIQYDYKVVNHILAGTIDKYEKVAIKKAEVRIEKDKKKEAKRQKEWEKRKKEEEQNPLPKPEPKRKAKTVPPAQDIKKPPKPPVDDTNKE